MKSVPCEREKVRSRSRKLDGVEYQSELLGGAASQINEILITFEKKGKTIK